MKYMTFGDIARHYRVDDIPEAMSQFLRLSNILDAMHNGRSLHPTSLDYIQQKGLVGLYELASGLITFETYIRTADSERLARAQTAEADRQVKAQERAEQSKNQRKAAENARIARERDPKHLVKMQMQALCKKYDIDSFHQPLPRRVGEILQRIDAGNRLTEDDFVWLTTAGKKHFTEPLKKAYHCREAEFCASEYRRTQDPWNVVNASGHYRKCDQPATALELLASVPTNRLKQAKVQSAMCTTRGGVMRDLCRLDEARQQGELGHELQPQNFRPCTLLGAVHMELGNYANAHDWYAKATERGASEGSIDTELRSIFQRATPEKREAIRAHLLAEDSNRYSWVNDAKYLRK